MTTDTCGHTRTLGNTTWVCVRPPHGHGPTTWTEKPSTTPRTGAKPAPIWADPVAKADRHWYREQQP